MASRRVFLIILFLRISRIIFSLVLAGVELEELNQIVLTMINGQVFAIDAGALIKVRDFTPELNKS